MKKYLLSLAVLVMFATPAHAFTVTCTNCSNMLVQMLDRVFDNYVMTPQGRFVLDALRPVEKRDPYGVEEARKMVEMGQSRPSGV